MPFPWKKKTNVTRFSQLVADLHHSPKRGSSLVVHTGFPTSLIDLFVKNRSRFNKSKSSNKPVHVNGFPPPPPPPPPPSPVTTPTHQPTPIVATTTILNMPALSENAAVGSSGRVCECGTGSGASSVGVVLVKMFVVLVLIFSVKWITIGITVSAFTLLFLEYAGKRVASSPFSDANVAKMESFSKRVSESPCVFLFLKLMLLLRLRKVDNNTTNTSINNKNTNFEVASVQLESIDEIEVAEILSEVGICCEESLLIDGNRLKDSVKLDCNDDDDEESSSMKFVEPCGISKCKSRGSNSFKAKMVKKLVPKKFRGYNRKEKKEEKRIKEGLEAAESGSQVSSAMDEENSHSTSFEVEEEERESHSLPVCVRCNDDDKGINCFQESILAKEEKEVINRKRLVIERDGNSGYTILLVIALAGLIVGRFPALILTITWCLVLKIVKTLLLLWRSHNCVPLVKYSVPNS